MSATHRPVGRPSRFSAFVAFEQSLPAGMSKRPRYFQGIGLFRGTRDYTVWVKIHCPRGGAYKGRNIKPGDSVEIKLGKRSSFDWPEMLREKERLQALADKGLPFEEAKVPNFAEYANGWLERKRYTLKGDGFQIAKGHVAKALAPTFGQLRLDSISVGNVNAWISKQRQTLMPATVQRQLSTFNAILNDAVRNGLIDTNPATRADKVKGIEPRQRFITDAEWNLIVSTAERIETEQEVRKDRYPHEKRGWLKNYVVWAYNSGMRRAEILNLTWDNVRHVLNAATQIEVRNTKSGKPRHVTCTTEMEDILVSLRNLAREQGDDRLFPVSMMTLKRSLAHLWRETGLKDVRLHDLRRTHATILMQQNVDPKAIAGRLGHSGLSMLGRHYAVDLGDTEAARRFGTRLAVAGPYPAAPVGYEP